MVVLLNGVNYPKPEGQISGALVLRPLVVENVQPLLTKKQICLKVANPFHQSVQIREKRDRLLTVIKSFNKQGWQYRFNRKQNTYLSLGVYYDP